MIVRTHDAVSTDPWHPGLLHFCFFPKDLEDLKVSDRYAAYAVITRPHAERQRQFCQLCRDSKDNKE